MVAVFDSRMWMCTWPVDIKFFRSSSNVCIHTIIIVLRKQIACWLANCQRQKINTTSVVKLGIYPEICQCCCSAWLYSKQLVMLNVTSATCSPFVSTTINDRQLGTTRWACKCKHGPPKIRLFSKQTGRSTGLKYDIHSTDLSAEVLFRRWILLYLSRLLVYQW